MAASRSSSFSPGSCLASAFQASVTRRHQTSRHPKHSRGSACLQRPQPATGNHPHQTHPGTSPVADLREVLVIVPLVPLVPLTILSWPQTYEVVLFRVAICRFQD